MANNMNAFLKEVQAEFKAFEKDSEDLTLKTVLFAHGEIVSASPKDTGRYAASNIISQIITSNEVAEDGNDLAYNLAKADKEKNKVKPKLSNVSWFISNNLDYVEAIEAGHSQEQAPNGVYNVSTIITKRFAKKLISKLQRKRYD